LQDEEADHAGTDDERGAIGWHLGDGDGVERDGDGLEHGCFGEGKLVWKAMNDAGGNDDILGKCAGAAVVAAGNAEDLAMIAEIYVAAKAVLASAAIDGGVEGDAVAFGESGDVLACGGDAPGGFVAHYDGGNAAAGGAVVAVDIAAADAARGDLDQDFIGQWRGLGEIGDFQVLVFGEEKSFHFVWAAALLARSLKPDSPTVTQIHGFLEPGLGDLSRVWPPSP